MNIPSRREYQYPQSLHVTETGLSFGSFGPLARVRLPRRVSDLWLFDISMIPYHCESEKHDLYEIICQPIKYKMHESYVKVFLLFLFTQSKQINQEHLASRFRGNQRKTNSYVY